MGNTDFLNLAKLNENINYRHFKMESLNTAMHLISKNCYFASVDLCNAYYSVPIASEHRKYLRFNWKQQTYEFTCKPNSVFHEINGTCLCHPAFSRFYFSGIY